jgi:hypothetical protein
MTGFEGVAYGEKRESIPSFLTHTHAYTHTHSHSLTQRAVFKVNRNKAAQAVNPGVW